MLNAPSRRSRLQVFFKIDVLKNSQYSQEKNLCWRLFSKKLQTFRPKTLLKETLTQMFSCEHCEIFKNKLRWLLLSFLDHFRCFAALWIPLSIYKCYVTCEVIVGSVSGIFKHYSRLYSPIFRTFYIPGIFRNLVYSKVRQYLDPCQTYYNALETISWL